ncbi:MAG: terminase small subunit [Bacteroidota bacterium]
MKKNKETIEDKELSSKQELFCQEYLIDLVASRAYKRAGFTASNDNVAAVEGHKLLRNPNVHARIGELMEERSKKLLIDAYHVMQTLVEINQRCMAKVTPVLEFDPVEKKMVQTQDEAGNKVYVFDAAGANRSIELIGKHLKMFTDKVDTNVIVMDYEVSLKL